MDGLLQTAIIVGMFFLRLGVPLLITLLVAYWLRRLDDKWQAEARARQETEAIQIEEKQTSAPQSTALKTNQP